MNTPKGQYPFPLRSSILCVMRDRPLIAIVDDDASVCRAIARLIRSSQMDAQTYSSARDFLDNGELHHPDCIVLDIQMPDMNGLALRDELRTRSNRNDVVFITAHDDEVTRRKILEGGSVQLHKPFSDQELLTAISNVLNEPDGE
jgi:FixJ family two-component response regulator